MQDEKPAPADETTDQNQGKAPEIDKPEDLEALRVGDEVLGLDGVDRPE